MEHRRARAAAIHAIKHQAMQMNVEMGRRAEALDERDRTAVSLAAFASRLFDQKGGNDTMDVCNSGESRSGWAANRMRSGIGNESTHWRTGTRGITQSTRWAALCAMRRAPQEGQNPRRLQEKATSLS